MKALALVAPLLLVVGGLVYFQSSPKEAAPGSTSLLGPRPLDSDELAAEEMERHALDAGLADEASPSRMNQTQPAEADSARSAGADSSSSLGERAALNADKHRTQFVVPPGAGPGTVIYGMQGQETSKSIKVPEGGSSQVTVLLESAHWVAAFLSEAGEVGPAVSFEVASAGSTVELVAPGSFDMSFTTISDASGDRLPGVRLRATRVDIAEPFFPKSAVEAATIDVTTDDAGFGRVDGFRFGEYRFIATLDGFDSHELTLGLPGPFSDQIQASGSADFGALPMTPLTGFSVQLEGYQDWGGAEGFSIAHTHEGTRFSFGPDGKCELELGWFSVPLYLKMWFPGGQRDAIFYLDGGLPPKGEVWSIDVAKQVTVEVDLAIAKDVMDQLDLSNATLRTTFSSPRGDSATYSVFAKEPGVYSIPGVVGSAAMVEFVAERDGFETSLAVERVSLSGQKRVSCTLAIKSLPTRVQLVDVEGVPMARHHLELRERHGRTPWAFGVTSDDKGELLAVFPSNLELSMRVLSKDRRTLAVDIPVVWEPSDEVLVVRLVSMPPMQIAATLDGVAAQGLEFEIFGAHSDQLFIRLETNSEGRTTPIQLIEGSTGRIRLVSKDLWTANPIVEVDSGETAVRVYSKGRLKLSPTEDVSRCIHMEEGQSLASWIERGLVKQVPGASNAWSVPSGTYRLERSDGSVWEEYLAPGMTLRVP